MTLLHGSTGTCCEQSEETHRRATISWAVQAECPQLFLAFHWYCRKLPGALTEDITAQLDEHLSIIFTARSFELQLLCECEGCQALLSQQHGTVLVERAQAQQAQQQTETPPLPTDHTSSCSKHEPEPGHRSQQEESQISSSGTGSAATAVTGLPGGDDMQVLLARARALMATTDLSMPEAAPAADVPPVAEPACSNYYKSCGPHAVERPAGKEAAGSSGGEAAGGAVSDDADDTAGELKAMMERARAAIAATAAALQEVQL